MKTLGITWLVELLNCNSEKLNDPGLLEKILKKAVELSGATIVKTHFHRYPNNGISGIIVISESHFAMHTWPEFGYCAIDIFTCGTQMDGMKAAKYLQGQLAAKQIKFKKENRGI